MQVVDSNGQFKKEMEWVLDTEGVNLLAVMSMEEVDYTRTTSNHIVDIIDTLGIEAARNALLKVRPFLIHSFICRSIVIITPLVGHPVLEQR